MYNLFLESQEIFTDEDKKKCIPTICELIDLANLTRTYGILELDGYISKDKDNIFLKQGLELILDGTDPVLVRAILQNFIKSGNYSGFELLNRYIMFEAMIAIQAGENPRLSAIKLSSMLGENYISDINKALDKEEKRREEATLELHSFLDTLKDKTAISGSENFEKLLNKMSHRQFYDITFIPNSSFGTTFLDDTTWSWSTEFAIALHGCGYNVIRKTFYELIHTHQQRMSLFKEMLLFENNASNDVILSSQEYILDMYNKIYAFLDPHQMLNVYNYDI